MSSLSPPSSELAVSVLSSKTCCGPCSCTRASNLFTSLNRHSVSGATVLLMGRYSLSSRGLFLTTVRANRCFHTLHFPTTSGFVPALLLVLAGATPGSCLCNSQGCASPLQSQAWQTEGLPHGCTCYTVQPRVHVDGAAHSHCHRERGRDTGVKTCNFFENKTDF